MRYYILGCIALGTTTGFLVGASQSPVVQYVLPLLFALVGGSAGVFALRTPASKSSEDKLRIVGLTTAALTVPFLAATVYGSLLRSGSGWTSLVPAATGKTEPGVLSASALSALSPGDAVSVLITNRNLALLQADDGDRRSIIEAAIEARTDAVTDFDAMVPALFETAGKLNAGLEAAAEVDPSLTDNSPFLFHLIELGNLIAVFGGEETRATKMTIARATAAGLADAMDDDFRRLLLGDADLAALHREMVVLLARVPDKTVLFDGVKEELASAVRLSPAPQVNAWSTDQVYRGIASTDY